MGAGPWSWFFFGLVAVDVLAASAGSLSGEVLLFFVPSGEDGDVAFSGVVVLFGVVSAAGAAEHHRSSAPAIIPSPKIRVYAARAWPSTGSAGMQ